MTTKKLVHALYAEVGGKVAYSTFVRLWAGLCKDVVIMKSKEDVCAVVCLLITSQGFQERERKRTTGSSQML